ncbi:hypothetical protein M378DRAFT_184981 [Amanita muscaria Koide BX008]|uniref:Uncharacterized protein n=1 Tax=Amanita muscaria (strain Koide BX008) TaxID=946122 RepID=A0A0C2SYH8_AMAMK|nr:hypothetical protein M378DRAFT_184981 [Amanita muscaria Koide BX008]
MSQSVAEQPRPAMRRKSSAQNLLSSFKSNNASTSPSIPSGSLSAATGYVMAAAVSQAAAPTVSTPHSRDWDSQSLYSDGVSNALSGAGNPALTQGTSIDILRESVHKRIITLTYIRSMHEGCSHWFHTILINRADLDKAFTNNDMKKRSFRYAMLGMSLSNLLDMISLQDLLRGLTNIMNEFDQAKEDTEKPKIRPTKRFIWKNAKNSEGGADGSYLLAHHIPFALDYHETLLSLLDVMSEVYNKILKLLGPSPFPQNQHYMGPLGLLSPHPGVSYLFSDSAQAPQNPISSISQAVNNAPLSEIEMNNSLWTIANSSVGIASGPGNLHSGASANSNAANWSGSWGDMLIKADNKIKKITTSLLKELDQLARNGIKDELASLDPLKLTVSEDTSNGRLGPEFEVLLT